MSRSTDRLFFRPAASAGALAAIALAVSLLAGCTFFGTPSAVADIRYDLGPAAAAASPGPLPAVKVLEITAPPALNNDDVIYRLSFSDNQRTATYANSHWTMPPAQLLTQRVRAALSSHGTVLTGGDAVHAPVLKLDLDEFEQVYDGQSESHGALSARATLIMDGKVIGQRTFIARAPSDTADAAGGTRALAAASDDFVSQLVVWLGMTPVVAAQ